MFIYYNDYWKDFGDQEIGVKPQDKVEIELTAGVWTDVTEYYEGGATFDQEKERAPDQISAGDTRYTFDNSEDTFTPTDAGSIFYGVLYQGKKIRFSVGFYGVGYYPQSTMRIKDIKWDHDNQQCYIFAQELMQRLVDENLNSFPSTLVAVPGAGNTGNGTITGIATKPFVTVTENWTLTCTTPGGNGVGIFDVVGSVSGDVGDATSGTEFSNASSGGIKFTISVGGVDWVAGGSPDTFTFSTIQYPEWTTTNPAKIMWSILTGYGYDSGTQDAWNVAVLDLDHTKSVDNIDINYTSFVNAITDIGNDLTGYISYDRSAKEVLQEIIIHFLGAIYTDNEGRIAVSSYKPSFGLTLLQEFADTKKIFTLGIQQDTAQIINQATVYCKRSANWVWSNTDETTDDVYSNSNTTSISNYGLKNPFTWKDFYWYSVNRAAQEWFADRLVDKFSEPPYRFKFETGLDAIRINLGDRKKFTDSRTNYSNKIVEILEIQKDFESSPKIITLTCGTTETGGDPGEEGILWCFLGSSEDEGDGISPQNADFDSANESDKQFCYLSQTGGEGSDPQYYLF